MPAAATPFHSAPPARDGDDEVLKGEAFDSKAAALAPPAVTPAAPFAQ
jgi:hypothetical protein